MFLNSIERNMQHMDELNLKLYIIEQEMEIIKLENEIMEERLKRYINHILDKGDRA